MDNTNSWQSSVNPCLSSYSLVLLFFSYFQIKATLQIPSNLKFCLSVSSRESTRLCKTIITTQRTDMSGLLLPLLFLWSLFLLHSIVNMFMLSDAIRLKWCEPVCKYCIIKGEETEVCHILLKLVSTQLGRLEKPDKQIGQTLLQLFPHRIS